MNVDTQTPYNNGYADGKQDGIDEQKAKIDSITITSNGTYTDPDGYSPVIVNVDTVTPYNNGFNDGVADQKSKLTTGTFTQNGTYTRTDGYDEVIVNVPSGVNNQNKTVNPSISQQVITAGQGYSGLGQVTVNAVTAAIDQDIQPENILEGVNILGVVGTDKGYNNGYADGESDQKAKLTSITITQNGTYTRTDGYDEVIVNVQCGAVNELVLSQESITMDYSGDFPVGGVSYQIGVYSTDNWTITSMPDWVSVDANSGLAGVSMFNLTVNSILDGRTGTVTITNGNVTKTITIVQNDLATRYLTFEVTSPGSLYWKQYGIAYSRAIQFSMSGTN